MREGGGFPSLLFTTREMIRGGCREGRVFSGGDRAGEEEEDGERQPDEPSDHKIR